MPSPDTPLTAQVAGKRLAVTCRALGIAHAEWVSGWRRNRYGARPIIAGVLVRPEDEERLREAIAARNARRPTPEQAARAKARRQEADIEAFAEAVRERFPSAPAGTPEAIARVACEVGSGRAGRCRDEEFDAVRAAVVAHVRHRMTDYDDLLRDGYDRDDARASVAGEIAVVLRQWES